MRRFAAGLVCAAVLSVAARAYAGSPDIRVDFRGTIGTFATITEGLANAFSASKVIIAPGTYAECPTVTGLVLLTIVGKKGVVIDATGCDAGLTINDGDGITVKGLTIVGAKTGILVNAAAQRVLITKTTVESGGVGIENGVYIDGAADVTIDKATLRGAMAAGVYVAGAPGVIVRKSTIADGSGIGVNVNNSATGATIAKNTFSNLGSLAVGVYSAVGSDSLVQSNKILGGAGGIEVTGGNNVIEKNTLTDLTGAGLLANGAGGPSTYRKNKLVRATAIAAIAAAGIGDTFEKNTVKEPVGDGLDVIGDGNRFIGNKVVAATGVGVLVEAGASGNTFEGTSSSKAGTDGFRVQGTGNTFTKAKASGSIELDLNDLAGGATTNVYTDCKFKTSNVP